MGELQNGTGLPKMGVDKATSQVLGYNDTEILTGTSADVTVADTFNNCRAISADTAGIVKVDYINNLGLEITEVLYLNAGILRPLRNVTKLYRYYTGTTGGTAESYGTDGVSIVNGLKLHR